MEEQRSSDVIFLISEDEEDVFCVLPEKTSEHWQTSAPQQVQRVAPADSAVDGQTPGSDLVNFIRTYFYDAVYSAEPKDIIQAVTDRPYCVYLYVGVELGPGRSASVLLIGYFDERSCEKVVTLLHTLQMSPDSADPHGAADTDSLARVADSDARLLVEALRKYELPLSNLAAFYCGAPEPGLSRVFVSRLRAFRPKLLSLCGVPGVGERACQASLAASFGHAVRLVADVHRHYSACPSVNDSLKEVFAHAGRRAPLPPASPPCPFIVRSVQKMATRWRDLQEYFTSLGETDAPSRIREQLTDDVVQLHFLFLSHALEPIRVLMEQQESESADLSSELHLTSVLLQLYAESVYRPAAAHRLLLNREVDPLHAEDLLPLDEVKVGAEASGFMRAHGAKLGEQNVRRFQKDAQAFYKAALQSLAESLSGPIGDLTLGNVGRMLKSPESITSKNFPCKVLPGIAVALGLCTAGSAEDELASNWCTFMKLLMEQSSGDECSSWVEILNRMRPWPTLHKLFLTLLALPRSLQRNQVFAKAYKSIIMPPNREKTPTVSPQVGKWDRGSPVGRRRLPSLEGFSWQEVKSRDDESSSMDFSSPAAKPLTQNNKGKRHQSATETDYTDNSSDVIDVTEEFAISRSNKLLAKNGGVLQRGEFIFIETSDEEDRGLDSTSRKRPAPEECLQIRIGELVWGQIEGFSPWPGIIVPNNGQVQLPQKTMVEWYGQRMCSLVDVKSLKLFAAFSQYFCPNSFATLITYREAVLSSLQEAAARAEKQFSPLLQDSEELLKQMLDWAFGGFQPSGPDGLKPKKGVVKANSKPKVKKKLFEKPTRAATSSGTIRVNGDVGIEMKDVTVSLTKLSCTPRDPSSGFKSRGDPGPHSAGKPAIRKRGQGGSPTEGDKSDEEWGKVTSGWHRKRGRGSFRARKSLKKSYSLLHGLDDDMSPDFVPHKKRVYTKAYNKVNQPSQVYTQPDQKLREKTINRIMDLQLNIEDFCLCCGTEDISIPHPLFKGSLCLKCKSNFTETLYRYDDDGYQSYCTICCYGMEVILCGHDGCHRSYCEDCLNILAGPGTFNALKALDPWICYLCQPHQLHGALVPREDWRFRVQELFANTSAMEFEPHRVYPSVPTKLRRPLRVLSLFDGIGTGYLVLKDLGFKVEKYVASEVCEDSVAVAAINHDGRIVHVGDVRFIADELIQKWGPFDLLIGGSPCNDLSIVNPLRKGLYEGTGRLFFEYYRILQLLKPKDDDPRPFFWLFENVVFMNTHDKVNICRFLECNPVLVDAVKVSPANRARYFWGNIPGMSRPIIASQKDKLDLQDCLELGREARVSKVRTITTNPNSLKQGKNVSLLPVMQNGKEDNLWITELEKIFGFPKHYTDVRNMNRQQRQKLLGKAWSVPVIRHLFAPLKEYFACEELPPSATPCGSASSPDAPSSPNSPDPQQLR